MLFCLYQGVLQVYLWGVAVVSTPTGQGTQVFSMCMCMLSVLPRFNLSVVIRDEDG